MKVSPFFITMGNDYMFVSIINIIIIIIFAVIIINNNKIRKLMIKANKNINELEAREIYLIDDLKSANKKIDTLTKNIEDVKSTNTNLVKNNSIFAYAIDNKLSYAESAIKMEKEQLEAKEKRLADKTRFDEEREEYKKIKNASKMNKPNNRSSNIYNNNSNNRSSNNRSSNSYNDDSINRSSNSYNDDSSYSSSSSSSSSSSYDGGGGSFSGGGSGGDW